MIEQVKFSTCCTGVCLVSDGFIDAADYDAEFGGGSTYFPSTFNGGAGSGFDDDGDDDDDDGDDGDDAGEDAGDGGDGDGGGEG
jgi:hypothetical protein